MADVNEAIGGYRLRNLLQTGQLSQVFEVVEPASNRHFAMKVLLPEAAEDPAKRADLFHEAEVGIKLKHPNVVHIHKIGRDPKAPFFVMDYFPAGSLRLRLQAKDMAFIKEQARRVFKETATGLAYMNATGYVHRDVKPDNILANALGETRIIDFAITKKVPTGFAKWFYRRGKPQGTPSFMSPEQIRDEIPNPRQDIYSYGCTLYELTAGRPPFRGTSTSDLLERHFKEKPAPLMAYNPDVTEDFSDFVLRLLAKNPKDRPANFYEVMFALRDVRQIFKSVPEKKREG